MNKSQHFINRRDALQRLGLLSLAGISGCNKAPSTSSNTATVRPHIFIRGDEVAGQRSVAAVRRSIESGIPKQIWDLIQTACEAEIGQAPLTARSMIPKRSASQAEKNNPDYYICEAAGKRVLRNALALLLTENEVYKKTALEQIWALIDESVWPDWIDQAHLRFEHPADLRTGMLSQDLGIGFDWLYPFLNKSEKDQIIEGLDRRGIQAFLTSMEQDPWWSHDMNNWYTVIIGGCGVAGMALGDAHPQSQQLIDLSLTKMNEYLSIYGAGGEFNESVAYSNATRFPVNYFMAHYYHMAGGENLIAKHPFPQTGEWTVYSTLPPGYYAAFGDGWIDAEPMVGFMTAIAAASRNTILQDFAKRHLKTDSDPFLLLWFDPDLETSSPEGKWPRGRAFTDNGAHIYSRTDWNPDSTTMVVYGKAKRDHNHAHNDTGQVCIDAMGQRMIVDLGSPSGYPADFFDENRWKYYNASSIGHNVPMFGNREQRFTPHTRGVKSAIDWDSVNGKFLQTHFEEDNGGYWQLDLTNAYDEVKSVRRTVVHLFPGFVAVLDEGELNNEEDISLRWHTISLPELADDGSFSFVKESVGMAGQVAVFKGALKDHQVNRHEYKAPHDKERIGDPLEQRREPYVETQLKDSSYQVLSLFALNSTPDEARSWRQTNSSWLIETSGGDCEVSLSDSTLRVSSRSGQRSFEVTLR